MESTKTQRSQTALAELEAADEFTHNLPGVGNRFHPLGKATVFDIANTHLLPRQINPQEGGTLDEAEGQSIVEKFLIHLCPVYEEEIRLKIDQIGKWRSRNLAQISHIANTKLLMAPSQRHLAVHPRVMSAVIDKGSLTENPVLIEMWANYLVAACTFTRDDERYVGYIRFLENLSPGQAAFLIRLSGKSGSQLAESKPEYRAFSQEELFDLTEADELSEVEFDLLNLQALQLVDIEWHGQGQQITARMTSLGIQFYRNTQSG